MWKSESNQRPPRDRSRVCPLVSCNTQLQHKDQCCSLCSASSRRWRCGAGSGDSFVAAAAASRSMIAEVSCPPDPLREPRAVLLFTGHLKGTCAIHPGAPAKSTRSPKIDAIVNQIRWCREAFGGGCHAFLHTWSTLDKAPIRLDGVALSRLNLSQRLVPGGFLKHGSRSLEHTPRSSSACVEQIRAAVGARHLTVVTETQVPQVSIEQASSPWGIVPEVLDLGMRMQLAGIGGGLALAARHVPCYDALVRRLVELTLRV